MEDELYEYQKSLSDKVTEHVSLCYPDFSIIGNITIALSLDHDIATAGIFLENFNNNHQMEKYLRFRRIETKNSHSWVYVDSDG